MTVKPLARDLGLDAPGRGEDQKDESRVREIVTYDPREPEGAIPSGDPTIQSV